MKIEIEFTDEGAWIKRVCSVPNAMTVEEIDIALEMLKEVRDKRAEEVTA